MVSEGEVRSRISDEDIIEGYLRPKVNGEAIANPRFIVDNMEEELYTREPWLLPQPTDPILNPREWFYLGKRNRKYRQAEGVHCEGAWILIQGRSPVLSEESGEIIGATMRFRYCFRNKNDKSAMAYSNWFMREYRLCDKSKPYNTPHVLCKITCNL
ncbi:PREDICTED: NAC transcription factor NAM-B2 [Camelina sativa]|uniref:NAC transcription factor NAM-B2 n=1 Tax=Camelina sativa TaxID=90675 RepID=A0ABM0ZAP1_CAMSA|nr:PREDICTED: NAC transcription factor NAM-B2 [Camelina sativa]